MTTQDSEGAEQQGPLSDLRREVLSTAKSVTQMDGVGGGAVAVLVLIAVIYVGVVFVAAPVVLFPDVRFSSFDPDAVSKIGAAVNDYGKDNNVEDEVRLWSCVAILLLPLLGFSRAWNLIGRVTRASNSAARIDLVTSSLRRDHARLHGKFRHQLRGEYQNVSNADVSGQAEAVAAMEDAVRLSSLDRWDRPASIIDQYAPGLLSGIGLLSNIQRISLQLGILFTFVGLAMALGTDAFRGSDDMRAGLDVTPLVAALQVAFCSSIAGLIASISMILVAGHARISAQRALQRMEVMVDNIFDLAKQFDTAPEVIGDLRSMRQSITRISETMEGMRDGFSQAMQESRDGSTLLADELRAARDLIANYREAVSRLRAEELTEAIHRGVSSGAGELRAVVKTSLESADRLAKVVEQLARLEIDRAEAANNTRDELARLRALVELRPPAAATVTGALRQFVGVLTGRNRRR